jgi:hypothetical protein
MALHPDAVLLSLEEATRLGHKVAQMWPHACAAESGGNGQIHCHFLAQEKE